MIRSLTIKNYALIHALALNPSVKLNVITGETGAGKSIILGAIGLLLGKRADTKMLFDKTEKCFVEAEIDIKAYRLHGFFSSRNLEYDDTCIIRREISQAGKSRAFVNDTPVTLDILRTLSPYLMDIHAQHTTLALGKQKYQRETLDHFGRHGELLADYQTKFKTYDDLRKRILALEAKAAESAKETDYRQFILKELEEADLNPHERQPLEEEIRTLEAAEEIKENLTAAHYLLDESEASVLNQLKEISSRLGKIQEVAQSFQMLFSRVESAFIELKDIADEINAENDRVTHDPVRLEELKNRLDLIYRLQQKHDVDTIEDLITLQDELSRELNEVINLTDTLDQLAEDITDAEKKMLESGRKLTDARHKTGKTLAVEIERIIRQIGMENARMSVKIHAGVPAAHGLDDVEFWFSANKGMPLSPMKNVASGGEFSRLTFAVKYLIADKTALPTIIFDEIETGISGEIAIRMIRLIKQMSDNHQIISISHLPQFAAGANHHYLVYKNHEADRSESKVKKLEKHESISEIAGMIGGENPTATARESAKELFKQLTD